MSNFHFAKKINKRFGLYQDIRPREEDDLIFEKISRQCLFETVRFLDERLTDRKKIQFEKKISAFIGKEDEDVANNISNVLSSFIIGKEMKMLLDERLDSFIDNLYFATIKKIKK